jgi:peptidoglycan/LPS O-acetylase OafA/YrhL
VSEQKGSGIFFSDVERLRAFCCIMVVLHHIIHACNLEFTFHLLPRCLWVGNGAIHVFFAISGFFITYSLKNRVSATLGESFLDRLHASKEWLLIFYKKRFFRIVPVLLFVLVGTMIFYACTEKDPGWFHPTLRSIVEIFCGSYNNSVSMFAETEKIHYGGFGLFWTLSVEMQFYMLWPLVLLMCKTDSRRAILSLVIGCAFLFVIQPLVTIFYGFKYYAINNNVSELFLGSFFAYLCKDADSICHDAKHRWFWMSLAAILAMLIWIYPSICNIESDVYFGKTVVSILSIGLTVLAIFIPGSFDFPVLNKLFNFLGRRSYAFYAVQLMLANIIVWYTNSIYFSKESFSKYDFAMWQFVMFFVLLFVVTELVFRFIEKPFRKFGGGKS